MSDFKSIQPRPNKVTDQIPNNDNRADEKALEIAKTGKVTAVVTIMHLYGNTESNSINTSAKNSAKKTKLGSNSKKLDLNWSKKHPKEAQPPLEDASKRLRVKHKTIRVLLDTGSSGDLLFLKKGSNKYIPIVNSAVPESWSTSNGTFKTKKVGEIELSFVDYSASKKVHLRPDIVEYPKGGPKPLYNLIIGKQTLHDIGAVLNFKERTITIDDILLLIRNINNLQLKSSISRALKLNSSYAQEQESTCNATKHVVEILDAKYDKADLPSIVKNNCMHLSTPHWNLLLALLLKYEELFDGMLGDWKLPPVPIELKEGAKPYHGRPYPIQKVHKATLMKEIDCLIAIGVLKWQPLSKWVSPSFIIPKKDHTVHTISDFRELNKGIVRKPYPIPKISTTLQELEGFTYATTLDLNMGYYNIRLNPTTAKIGTIIFPWGKYLYQRLPMGFARSADIFQVEMGNLMAALEYVRAYIDDLLVITKSSHDDHLGKLEQVFIRLCDAWLKINAAKSFFCAQEMEYLGYILTRSGIKPQPKKVQAILALNLPKSVKELQRFLGMVQYYRNMWAKCSEMLAPLTDLVLVGECGETKATKKNGTKQKPWRWESIHQQAFDNVKATITKEVVLAYPDFTKLLRYTLTPPQHNWERW